MAQQTAVMQIAKSFRDWQRAWDSFDKNGLYKPPSFDEFVEPFLAMEKEQIINADLNGSKRTIAGFDLTLSERRVKELAEQYYNKSYNK